MEFLVKNAAGKNADTVAKHKWFLMALLAATGLVSPRTAAAQVAPANTATSVYKAPNGVPVVDIANPNAAGLSHNKFLDYNVDSKGLVLNNGDTSQAQWASQLAGAVSSNLNLTKQANVILNEVVTTNRSLLAGYTEVTGKAADVIVANPNGITCNGCGFINTPNVTLTTGAPVLNGTTGALAGFSVNDGDILVTGTGLDASKQDYLGLIARSLKLQGQINAKALDIIAGANDVDYATKAATAHAGTGIVPTLAVDSSALGGMYVDRIRLVATEAGVGVRMLGDVAAGVGDFTLDSAGKIEVGSKISAKGKLRLNSTASGADAVKETDATLTSAGDMTISATAGNVHLAGGALTSQGNMLLQSDTLTDAKSATTLTDNNKRYAAGTLTLNQTGAITLDGTSYGAGGTLAGTVYSLTVGSNGETLYGDVVNVSATGNLSLASAGVQGQHDVTLASSLGKIITASATGQGIKSVLGAVNLTAGGGITNAGVISAKAGALSVKAGGTILNNGTIYAKNGATVTDKTGAAGENITNTGTFVADNGLTVKAAALNNSGTLQGTDGSSLTLTSLTNTGTLIASANAAKTGAITAGSLTDNGVLTSAGNLTLGITNTLTLADNKKLVSAKDLTITANALSMGGSGAQIIAGQAGSGTGTVTVATTLTNPGMIFAKGTLNVTAPAITNNSTGALAATGALHAKATSSNFVNFGQLYGGTLVDVQAPTFANQAGGSVDGGQDVTFSGTTFYNYNNVTAGSNLTVSALYFYNEIPGGDQRQWSFDNNDTSSDTGWGSSPSGLLWGQSTNKYHTRTWTDKQYYGTTPPSVKPEMVAGSTLSIKDFSSALNLGAVISAPTVNITSTQPGATFTNDDYGLTTRNYTETWRDHASCCHDVIYLDYSYGLDDTTSHTTSTTTYGGGIYANTLNASGFALSNLSGLYPVSVTTQSASGTLPTPATVGGITITLPSNPNGLFIVSKNPNSQYLIETNPMYGVGSSFLGSNYMIDRYGIDPDTVERRLGDANYEAYLIREQLLNAGAAALLNVGSEADAMQKLMDNGVNEGKALGLTIGVAPTAAQLAKLTGDMVWMVDTVVQGQHVLAPVVYLSAATKSQIASGAVIQATNANLQLASLNNSGGTIAGSENLNITTEGNLTNTSGTIKGGNVALTSTNGDIVNQTATDTSGGAGNQHTDVGKTAGIIATGNLSVDAKNDITNKGANMSAGGDASLKAGNNITFDTVEDKESSQSHSGGNDAFAGGTQNDSTTSSTTNIHSGLTVGGNLSSSSGGDTTFAGTNVKTGGNADIKAGGDLNVIARNDSTETTTSSKSGTVFSGDSTTTHDKETTNQGSNFDIGGNLNTNSGGDTTIQGSNINVKGNGSVTAGGNINVLDGQNTSDTSQSSTHSGLGVGGGIYGVQGTTDTDTKSSSVASNLNFGGNGTFKAGNDMTVQGSNVKTGGDMNIDAKDVNVLEGRNNETSTHSETTVSFGKIDGSGSSSSSGASAGASSGSGDKQASADAGAEAHADANANGGVTLMEANTTTTTHTQSHAAGSSLTSGGNMNVNATGDVTVRGSNVNAGGDANINAKNVNVLAAQDLDTTSTTSSDTKLGLYGNSDNHADASADAQANAQAGGEGSPSADASADAQANANSDNTLDFMHNDEKTDTVTDITHTGSSIHSGGNMNVNAKNDLNVNGSSMDSGGDMSLNANNMSFTAATDSHTETTTDSATKMGLYADAGASADAQANAGAQGLTAGAGASADAQANAGVGIYGSNTTSSSTTGSTTAQTSSIHSGGNMTRNATNNITDEGTQIDAGGNFNQSSKTWDSKAAHDTTFSTSSSDTNTGKLGLYAQASAGASAGASSTSGVDNGADANASAGLEASYSGSTSDSSADSSHAVVSNIHSGGSMTTTTTGKTSLEGTNLNSGGDMTLNAGSLDYKAAQDTEHDSNSTSNTNADMKVGVSATKAVDFSASGGYDQDKNSHSSTTAVTGGMNSGGNLHINTKGDANFEGTNLNAKGDAGVNAGGSVNFAAAHNTESSSDTNFNASGSVSLSKSKGGNKGAGFSAEGGYGTSSSNSNDAVAGSITSGGKLDVKAGKDATFEGTNLNSGGDASVEAKGDVNFNAAKSTSSSTSTDLSGSLSLSKGGAEKGKGGTEKKKGSSAGIGFDGSYSKDDETTSAASNINSGGKLTIKSGHDVNLEGTNIASQGNTTLDAGHDVNFKAATNTSNKIGVSGGLELGATKPAKGSKEGGGTEKEGNVSLDIAGGKSTTKTGGSINAGSITIKSGNDTTLEGTKTHSDGDTSIAAGGNVNLATADSSHVEGGFGGSIGSGGGGLTKASIGGGADHQETDMSSGGDLKITSGGKTTMEGSTLEADGKASVDAKGGVEKKTVVSGGGDLGLDHAGADLKVKETEIKSKNLAPAQIKLVKEFDAIKKDPNLSPAQKVKMMLDKIKNDPDLTKAQKDKMTADIVAEQKKSGE